MAATTTRGMPLPVRAWVLAVTLIAVVGVMVLAGHTAPGSLLRPLPLALVAGVALAEVFSVWDFGRPRNCSVTVSELFVGVAFVALEPGTALGVCVAGSLVTPPLRASVGPLRRVPARSPFVLVHSVAMPVLRCVAGVAALVLVADHVGPGWAALAGLVALQLVDTVTTGVVVHLDTGMSFRRAVTGNVVVEYLAPLGAGAFGVVLGLALAGQALAWLVVAAMAGVVVAVSHAGTRWSRERRRSRLLLEVSESTVRTAGDGDVAHVLAAHVADALLARRVEVTPTRPGWADLTAPLGGHGWLAVAGRAIPTQDFDHRDQELLDEVATVATVVLDNGELLARLADAELLRSTLLAAAAHDLRGPLALTAGTLDILRLEGDGLDASVRARLLESASRATHRADQLVHDLIVLERQHLAADAPTTAADPVAVARQVLAALPAATAARCTIEVDGEVPPVAMGAVLLERVIDNLVGNAVKHTPDDGPVRVRLRSAARGRVAILVEDRGPGVPPDQREKILAPFARAVASGSGYGLGLHIATEFLRRADGELVISDRDDGPGACFRVDLPAADR